MYHMYIAFHKDTTSYLREVDHSGKTYLTTNTFQPGFKGKG